VALIPKAMPVAYIARVRDRAKAGLSMTNGGSASPWHFQQFVVDVLILTSTTAIALAAVSTIAEFPLILIAAALIGVGLMLDPSEPTAAQQPMEHFDAALVDAASL
jgi:uncharacterized membrane protein YadS